MVLTRQHTLLRRTWDTSVGRKAVMAVTGVIFLLYLVVHMIGNLRVFLGPAAFDAYARHLRTFGAELLGYGGFVWIVRVVLLGSVLLHVGAAGTLWYRARRARPIGYRHRPSWAGGYAARTMRWGGVILALFVVWHVLDVTLGVVNPAGADAGTYAKLVASFERPVVAVFYIVAMLALGLHVRHGLWSAAQTLGARSVVRRRSLTTLSVVVATAITAGFVIVPISVMAGWVR